MSQSTLESRNFLATNDDVRQLTESLLAARNAEVDTRQSYLRVIVAKTQEALGLETRLVTGRAVPIEGERVATEVEAIDRIHETCYAIVLATIAEHVPGRSKGRKTEINRQATFARTATSTLRRWVRAGHSVASLAPTKVTKAGLAVEVIRKHKQEAPSKALKARVDRVGKALIKDLIELSEVDKDAALEELRSLMGSLSFQMQQLGIKPTRDLNVATSEGRPFQSKSVMFVPTETTLVRMQERPA